MDETTAFDICAFPKEITMDAKEDLPTVVIRKTEADVLALNFIQSSSGSAIGGDEEPYNGDYRTRVAIVKQSYGGYPQGVYSRIEITTFGSKSAPKAFKMDYEILSHRESAEVGESSVCTGIAYKL
jgi:hypothetical protein